MLRQARTPLRFRILSTKNRAEVFSAWNGASQLDSPTVSDRFLEQLELTTPNPHFRPPICFKIPSPILPSKTLFPSRFTFTSSVASLVSRFTQRQTPTSSVTVLNRCPKGLLHPFYISNLFVLSRLFGEDFLFWKRSFSSKIHHDVWLRSTAWPTPASNGSVNRYGSKTLSLTRRRRRCRVGRRIAASLQHGRFG